MPPIIDLHCDTLYRLASAPERFFAPAGSHSSHISYHSLRAANSLLQCFAVFTDLCELPTASPLSFLTEQLRCFQKILSLSEGQLMQIRTFADLATCIRQGNIGALLTLEESCLSEQPVTLLPELYSLGIRIATLTWDYSNLLATSAAEALPVPYPHRFTFRSAFPKASESFSGLSPAGYAFLEEAERLGILIDVSHLSDAGFRDVAAHSKRPFLATHSNSRSVCNVPRNLSDDMLRTLANRGGLAGLCLHEPFLLSPSGSKNDPTEAIIAHVRHILSITGSEVLVLGTDFDGTSGNRSFPDISALPRLADLLKKAGVTSGQIDRLFYKNALRFFQENLPA